LQNFDLATFLAIFKTKTCHPATEQQRPGWNEAIAGKKHVAAILHFFTAPKNRTELFPVRWSHQTVQPLT
jgi:hypothetical protein